MSATADKTAPLFKPVEWVNPRDQADTGRYRMLSTIRDLASGVALALQLVERADIQRDLDDAPVIDGSDAQRFTKMSIAAMHVIEGYIDEHFDEMTAKADARQLGAAGRGAA